MDRRRNRTRDNKGGNKMMKVINTDIKEDEIKKILKELTKHDGDNDEATEKRMMVITNDAIEELSLFADKFSNKYYHGLFEQIVLNLIYERFKYLLMIEKQFLKIKPEGLRLMSDDTKAAWESSLLLLEELNKQMEPVLLHSLIQYKLLSKKKEDKNEHTDNG